MKSLDLIHVQQGFRAGQRGQRQRKDVIGVSVLPHLATLIVNGAKVMQVISSDFCCSHCCAFAVFFSKRVFHTRQRRRMLNYCH